jgi:hypothetical protein
MLPGITFLAIILMNLVKSSSVSAVKSELSDVLADTNEIITEVKNDGASFKKNDELLENNLLQRLRSFEKSKVAPIFRYSNRIVKNASSTIYRWEDMLDAIQIILGFDKYKLWDGGSNATYGLVNIAAFLAQAMAEGISANTCNELNSRHPHEAERSGGAAYPAAAACGQGKELYQDKGCTDEDEDASLSCLVNPNMIQRAVITPGWADAPPGFFCAPRILLPRAPKWVTNGPQCAPSSPIRPQNLTNYIEYVNRGGRCRDYRGIIAAGWLFDNGCENNHCAGPTGRTDVEGCCWWGRGVLLTSGVCILGKLNHYMKKITNRDDLHLPNSIKLPEYDLCGNPDAVCDKKVGPWLKWLLGLFHYVSEVQNYSGDWDYKAALENWVDSGMKVKDTHFIDMVSRVFKSGSPFGFANGAPKRSRNFFEVLKIFGLIKKG